MKTCTKCKRELPLSDFYIVRKANRPKPGVSPRCKTCISAYAKAYRDANVEWLRDHVRMRRDLSPEYRRKQAAAERQARYRRLYGATVDELKQMLDEQGGQCAICERPLVWTDRRRHVDHVNTTSGPQVRGILCRKCNNGMGFFNHDPALLLRAVEYLNAWALGQIQTPAQKAKAVTNG